MWLTRPHRGFFERKKRGKKMKKGEVIYLSILYPGVFKKIRLKILRKYEADRKELSILVHY